MSTSLTDINYSNMSKLRLLSFSLTAFMTGLKELNPFYETTDQKAVRYWTNSSPTEAIEEADRLFEQRKFLDVYELLNRPKFNSSVEVQWRIGRVLYKLSTADGVTKKVKRGMIDEANYVLNGSLTADPKNANVHKWLAIITHAKAGMTGIAARIKSYEFCIMHLKEAVKFNPNDAVSFYLLGKLCYELANLTNFQKFVAKTFYHPAPECKFEDALEYFLRAEEAKPRFYLPNLYMLGITCLKLNQLFRARYYLNVAASLPPRTRKENEYTKKAKEMADHLDKYDLTQEAVFLDMPFDN